MKKLITLVLLSAVVITAGIIGYSIYKKSAEGKFIKVNPVNVNQILQISKFRSCEDQDFSGYNTDMELETKRSMKHYFSPRGEFSNSNSSVSVYAPFDGLITDIMEESSRDGYIIKLSPKEAQNYVLTFFHINPNGSPKKNDTVTAGQQIGFAMLDDRTSFDISLEKYVPNDENKILESIFDHMTSKVLGEYTSKGIKIEDLMISKRDRDKMPCTFGAGSNQDEWITLD